jgi:hypothetical protein
MLPPTDTVMEVKVNERMPYWLTQLIAAENLQIQRISKYCRSIDAAHWSLSTARRRVAADRSEEVLASLAGAPAAGRGADTAS